MKKIFILLALSFCICTFSACGNTEKVTTENLKNIVLDLKSSEKDLGLENRYSSINEILDGYYDDAIIGTWSTSDGLEVLSYSDKGDLKTKTLFNGNETENDIRYICIELNNHRVICEGADSHNNYYYTYKISGDVLYQMKVETSVNNVEKHGSNSVVKIFYRADETGSIKSSIKSNPINPESFYGNWTNEKTTLIINESGLCIGDKTYDFSVNDQNQLVIKKDGISTSYSFNYYYSKEYTDDNQEQPEKEGVVIQISYLGSDESDKPNLADVMLDWHTEFAANNYADWYYTAEFELNNKDL